MTSVRGSIDVGGAAPVGGEVGVAELADPVAGVEPVVGEPVPPVTEPVPPVTEPLDPAQAASRSGRTAAVSTP